MNPAKHDRGAVPVNIEAEKGLLGAVLLKPEGLAAIAGKLLPNHFSEPLHQQLYSVCIAMAARGATPSPISVIDHLPDDQKVGDMTIMQYLASLVGGAATMDPSGYVEVLVDLATRRSLIGIGETIQEVAHTAPAGASPKEQIEQAIERLSTLAASGLRRDQKQSTVGAAASDVVGMIERGVDDDPPISTGLTDLDRIIGGYRRGNLLILSGRPGMGKSLLAGSSALKVAQGGDGVLFFSKEMTKDQLTARLLTDLSLRHHQPITYDRVLNRKLDLADRPILKEAAAKLKDLPFIIDPQPGLSITEIAMRTRRVREAMERRGKRLGLVVIDHLGKVKAGGRRRESNRNIELGEITGSSADLAKDTDTCIMMLCQLNRGVESRDNKRPLLSDLRECLSASALLTNAETGERISIRDVEVGTRVLSMSESTQKIVPGKITEKWEKGIKPAFRLKLKSGRQIEATASHPFFSSEGFCPLSALRIGDDIAVGMESSAGGGEGLPPELCRLLGYMVGDGTCLKHREVGFVANTADHEVLDDYKSIIAKHFPRCEIRERPRFNAQQLSVVEVNKDGHGKPGGNSFRQFLRSVGLHGQSSFTKRVPPIVFQSGAEGAAEFVLGYLQTDGTVKKSYGKSWVICFSSVNHDLLGDVLILLARIGIPGQIITKPEIRKGFNASPLWTLRVPSLRSILIRFMQRVPMRFRKMNLLQRAVEENVVTNETGPSVMALPHSVSRLLAEKTKSTGMHWSKRWYFEGKRMRRSNALNWADKLNDDEIRKWAESDIVWDQVIEIESIGNIETYDIRVAGTHTFLANGIVVHNSGHIEEDADSVISLYRPAYYLAKASEDDPEKEMKREQRLLEKIHDLEAIVPKNRHGSEGVARLWIHPGTASVRDKQREHLS